jgi:hypothetical protein
MRRPIARRLGEAATRVVYEAGTVVGKYPSATLAVARRRGHGEPLGPGTDLVIEGYPRSANTFAVIALSQAQPRPTRIAHHVHAPGHVIAAVRHGLPALVLVRDPEEAVIELALLKPALTLGQALRGYVRFYAPLLPYRGGFVVATTQEVLAGVSVAVRRLNARFGTSFVEPAATQEAMEAARRGAAEYMAGRGGTGLPVIGRTSRSEEGRDADRERLRAAYRSARLARTRARAHLLHQTFTKLAADLPEARKPDL